MTTLPLMAIDSVATAVENTRHCAFEIDSLIAGQSQSRFRSGQVLVQGKEFAAQPGIFVIGNGKSRYLDRSAGLMILTY